MNRYQRLPTGGPSKATANTLCQKCLKRGHYSYECKAIPQERPYVPRPSRTQQLFNPKLVPKLTSDVPQDLLRKEGIADEQLAKVEQERGRKRERASEEPETAGASKRIRSTSASSSTSVATISTNMSRSQSPSRSNSGRKPRSRSRSLSQSPFPKASGRQDQRFSSVSRSPTSQPTAINREKKRRRSSFSSVDSIASDDRRVYRRDSRRRDSSRSTRRRYQHDSPPMRGRRTESTSPKREARRISSDREPTRDGPGNGRGPHRKDYKDHQPHVRERSLSPFSKRLALTQSMNMGR